MIQLSKNLKSSKFSMIREEDKRKLDYLEGHSSKINAGIITSDSKFILTASGSGTFGDADNKIRIWNVKNRRQEKILTRHSSKITALSTTPNYKIVFSGDFQGRLILWKFETEEAVNQMNCGSTIIFLKFDDGSRQLFGSIKNSGLKIWKFLIEDLTLVQVFKTDFEVNFFYLSKNSSFYMIRNSMNCFQLNDLENKIFKMFKVDCQVGCITITDDQKTAIVGSKNNVIFFDTHTCVGIKKYSHRFSVILAEVSKDQSKLMTCTIFSFILWDVLLNSQLFNVDYVGKIIQVSSDFQNFLTTQGKSIGFFNLEEQKHKKLFNTHKGAIISAFTCPGSDEIVSLGIDSMLKVWDPHNLQLKTQLLLSKEYWKDLRLLESKHYYLITTGSMVATMRLKDLINSSVELSDLVAQDQELSENFKSNEYDTDTWESIQKCRF